jgi:hypothetical protein
MSSTDQIPWVPVAIANQLTQRLPVDELTAENGRKQTNDSNWLRLIDPDSSKRANNKHIRPTSISDAQQPARDPLVPISSYLKVEPRSTIRCLDLNPAILRLIGSKRGICR